MTSSSTPQRARRVTSANSTPASRLRPADGTTIGTAQQELLVRLRRIEGQARGIQLMIETRRTHGEVVMQIRSLEEAVRSTVRELFLDHLEACTAPSDARTATRHLRDAVALMRQYIP